MNNVITYNTRREAQEDVDRDTARMLSHFRNRLGMKVRNGFVLDRLDRPVFEKADEVQQSDETETRFPSTYYTGDPDTYMHDDDKVAANAERRGTKRINPWIVRSS